MWERQPFVFSLTSPPGSQARICFDCPAEVGVHKRCMNTMENPHAQLYTHIYLAHRIVYVQHRRKPTDPITVVLVPQQEITSHEPGMTMYVDMGAGPRSCSSF